MDFDALAREAAAKKATSYGDANQSLNALQSLEALEASGNMRPAERAALAALRQRQATDTAAVGETGATYRGLQQGATFNLADEIGGLVRGREHKEQMRAKDAAAQEQFPDQYGTGKTAGTIGTGLATSALTGPFVGAAKTLPGLMGRSAVVGGGEGAVYGAGEGEGLEDRLNKGVRTGATGAFVGGLAPPVVGGVVRGGKAVADMASGGIDAMINRGSQARARRAIAQALAKSGKSADDVTRAVGRAAADGQPEFRMMDAMGVAGQRLASGTTRAGGDGAEEIAQFLSQRQADQANRMAGFVEEEFTGPQTANQARQGLMDARSANADQAYSAARGNAAPVDIRGAVDVIDSRIGGMGGSNIAGDSIDGKLMQFRNRLMADPAPDGEIVRELSDFDRVLGVKQDISDAIGAATRAGRNNEARELTKLRNEIDSALEDASPSYRQANDDFATSSRVIDSVDEGAMMARPGARAADTTQRFQSMTPDQQSAARIGYGDKALAKIEANSSPTADVSKPFRSTKAQTEADAMATDPALFGQRVGREGEMWETQNRALGGSRTADNLQDVGNVGMMGNLLRAAKAAGNFQMGEAATNLGAAVGPALTGKNEATRKLIAEMLMSGDVPKVLAPIVRREGREKVIRRLLEGVGRGDGRENFRPLENR